MKKTIIDWTIALLIAILLFIIITGFFEVGRVSGQSMMPTYENGEKVFVQRKFYDLNYGDVITFWADKDTPDDPPSWIGEKILQEFNEIVFRQNDLENKELHIKRVVGLPKDHVVVRTTLTPDSDSKKATEVLVNDKIVARSSVEITDDMDLILKDDEYFVVGDNYSNSYDSRYHGPITKDQVFGKIVNGRENANEPLS